jgi:inosose dehydratase
MTDVRRLEPEDWDRLTRRVGELGQMVADEYGVRLVFHPHADSHVADQDQVERFLADTDPGQVSLCLDTGHIAYCGGDNLDLIHRFAERIGYVHLKQVDPAVMAQVVADDLCFAEAVRRHAMCEPPAGVPDFVPLLASLADLDVDLFAIVEQDLYPCDPSTPLPIARRTRSYLGTCGA